MKNVILKSYKVQDFQLTNNINGNVTMKLETKYGYNVKFAPNGICRSELSIDTHDREHPEMFSVKLILVGFFGIDAATPKEDLHVLTYDSIFPTARAIVSTATAALGIPPVMIPEIDIREQDIYRVDLPNKSN